MDEKGIKRFWLRDEGGHPRTLVGWARCLPHAPKLGGVDSGFMVYATATCSPRDKFDRKKAHLEVEHKLLRRGEYFTLLALPGIDPMAVIVAHIADTCHIDRVYARVAELWLRNRGIHRTSTESTT